jgi:3-dehydroquinate dehydratase-2
MDVLLINGPNLNALGTRNPEIYGRTTLADIEAGMRQQADGLGLSLDCYQSNHEGDIVDHIHRAKVEDCRYIIINPGAFTHTSVAIRDALEGVEVPFVEVHISNIHARESFRHHSYLSPLAAAVLVGCGVKGYNLALELVAYRLAQ